MDRCGYRYGPFIGGKTNLFIQIPLFRQYYTFLDYTFV